MDRWIDIDEIHKYTPADHDHVVVELNKYG